MLIIIPKIRSLLSSFDFRKVIRGFIWFQPELWCRTLPPQRRRNTAGWLTFYSVWTNVASQGTDLPVTTKRPDHSHTNGQSHNYQLQFDRQSDQGVKCVTSLCLGLKLGRKVDIIWSRWSYLTARILFFRTEIPSQLATDQHSSGA